MRLGDVGIRVVSDGTFRLDGGGLFGIVPKTIWQQRVRPDRKNRVILNLNCLVIQAGKTNILVDTGLGTKHTALMKSRYAMVTGKLLTGLQGIGLSPNDIHLVALTHLHFDHAGGCTRLGDAGKPVPTFPRAQYLAQRKDWEEATHPNERSRAGYFPDDFLPLQEDKQLELVDGDLEASPGVWLRRTGGHTAGHQLVLVESQGERAASLGDLLPTPAHLPLPYATAWDLYPLEGLAQKQTLLAQAEREGWLLLFGHGHPQRAGYLEREENRLTLREVDL